MIGNLYGELQCDESNIDYLTRLFNRRGLSVIFNSLSQDTDIHCMSIDVDNFKTVNDVYGHSDGDKLLIHIGKLLNRVFLNHYVVRLGGDEFFVILDGSLNRVDVEIMAYEVMNQLDNGEIDETIVSSVSLSIGIVFEQQLKNGLDEILQRCDETMYHAKNNGKGQFVVFDEIQAELNEHKVLEARAMHALDQNEIKVLLQPVVYLQNSGVQAAEIVLIWDYPGKGVLHEEEFLDVFEQSGLISRLDLYVLTEICNWKRQWKGTSFEPLDVYMKLSGKHILRKNAVQNLAELVMNHQINPQEIKLSIDESEFQKNHDKLIEGINLLMDAGFSIVIDNFGSASSLMVLNDVPSHALKLDKKLVARCIQDEKSALILRNMISLGRDLGLFIIGQGIDNTKQIDSLGNYGAHCGIGSFYGQPIEESQFLQQYETRLHHTQKKQPIQFDFSNQLMDVSGRFQGVYGGNGMRFKKVNGSGRNSIYFPGGEVDQNVLYLPKEVMIGDSYSFCFSINPEVEQSWSSIIYISYKDGFCSIVPNNGKGEFFFRNKDDREANVWYDVVCLCAKPGQWAYVCATYDAISRLAKLYFNGVLVGGIANVPTLKVIEKIVIGGDDFKESYRGSLADLEIYSYALSNDQIAQQYKSYLEKN